MRVLITATSGTGHVFPLIPLSRALAQRGNEVLWAVPGPSASLITAAGLPVAVITDEATPSPAQVVAAFPDLADLPNEERPEEMFGRLWGALVAPAMLTGLVRVAASWHPDLLLCDGAALAGHIVAAELGVPSVTSGFGPLLPAKRVQTAEAAVAPLWRSRGLEPRPYAGSYEHLYLDPFPAGLLSQKADHVPHRQSIRPVGYTGEHSAEPPPLPRGNSDCPLVYLTMGTVFNVPSLFEGIVAALSALEIRLLVTVGSDGDPRRLGAQPDHVLVKRFVPQSLVLGHCAVVVSHAGSGTVAATLALGRPQVCLPQGADQFLNARAVAEAGAGLSLWPGEATPAAVSEAVRRLLEEPSFREAAEVVAASIAAMPSPDEVAGVLEQLAAGAETHR